MTDKDLLKMLACPACKGGVRQEGQEIYCIKCGKRYPVRDGIPVMLIEEAKESDS